MYVEILFWFLDFTGYINAFFIHLKTLSIDTFLYYQNINNKIHISIVFCLGENWDVKQLRVMKYQWYRETNGGKGEGIISGQQMKVNTGEGGQRKNSTNNIWTSYKELFFIYLKLCIIHVSICIYMYIV